MDSHRGAYQNGRHASQGAIMLDYIPESHARVLIKTIVTELHRHPGIDCKNQTELVVGAKFTEVLAQYHIWPKTSSSVTYGNYAKATVIRHTRYWRCNCAGMALVTISDLT